MFVFSKQVNAGRSLYSFARILELADSIEARGYKGRSLEAVTFVGTEVPTDLEPHTTVLLRLVTAEYETLKAKANGKPVLLPVPGLSEAGNKLSRRMADAGTVLATLTAMSDRDEARMVDGNANEDEDYILYGANNRAFALVYREACALAPITAPVETVECVTIKEAQDLSLLSNRQGLAVDTRAAVAHLKNQVPRLGRAAVMADLACTGGKAQEYVAAAEAFTKWPALFDEYGGYTFNYKVHNLVREAKSLEAARAYYEAKAPERLNLKEELKVLLGALEAGALHAYLTVLLDKDTTADTDLQGLRLDALKAVNRQ